MRKVLVGRTAADLRPNFETLDRQIGPVHSTFPMLPNPNLLAPSLVKEVLKSGHADRYSNDLLIFIHALM